MVAVEDYETEFHEKPKPKLKLGFLKVDNLGSTFKLRKDFRANENWIWTVGANYNFQDKALTPCAGVSYQVRPQLVVSVDELGITGRKAFNMRLGPLDFQLSFWTRKSWRALKEPLKEPLKFKNGVDLGDVGPTPLALGAAAMAVAADRRVAYTKAAEGIFGPKVPHVGLETSLKLSRFDLRPVMELKQMNPVLRFGCSDDFRVKHDRKW